jgi:V8-like Glu-specific endopeptidase
MLAKPAVVRIYAGYTGQWFWRQRSFDVQYVGSGSGFLIHPNGYILTNAHVVRPIKEGDESGKGLLLFSLARQLLESVGRPVNEPSLREVVGLLVKEDAQLVQFRRVNYVFVQSGKRFPFEIKSYGAPVGQGTDLVAGKDVAVVKIEIKNAPTLRVGNSDEVQVGDRVYVMGYPGAADSAVLDERSALEPTTNDGAISARKTSVDGAPIFQTNTSATHGNSGGPVINERGEVIGLLTFRGDTVGGQEVQGFNFIVPSSTALEFVRQAGTDNSRSAVDERWREGLEHHWRQEYSRAKDKFAEAVALYPEHSEAQRLITDAQERIARGEDRSGAGLGLLLLGVGSGAVVLVGAVFALVVVHRKRQGRTVASAAPPSAEAPVPAQPEQAPEIRPTVVFQGVGQLVCTGGPEKGQVFPVGGGMYIGRDPKRCQVVISDAQVSGQHLWVGVVNGQVCARDCGSTNGTFHNNDLARRVREVALKDGDVLTLGAQGSVKFTFRG